MFGVSQLEDGSSELKIKNYEIRKKIKLNPTF